ncbi:hypothetical protein KIH39_12135 [Telmatocola sphagniphila]|uniref:Outer membrane lipoprotein-sorting protein n=1 Tax=Telmatocola sphagniphila TaxID=1123043 RepID=A0A8E6B9E0_9BACT|nr:hypothetical protein [Telmatocola sphagniphila]QVL34620.1 hypothetical protein KIH39_12135 [Telmatocola sphagniphila]
MRLIAMLFVLVSVSLCCAQGEEEARKIVRAGIEKIGGLDKVTSLKSGVWKTSGVFQNKQSRGEFRGELPGRFRLDSTRIVNGETVKSARIVDGKKGWTILGNEVKPMSEEQVASFRNSFYHKQVANTLLPLLDKECSLSKLGTVKIDDEPTTIVKATREGYPDLLLFFSDKTGLVVKSFMNEKNEVSGKEKKVEIFYSQFKDFGGFHMASRVKTIQDGKPFQEAEITEFKASSERLPEGTFAPAKK